MKIFIFILIKLYLECCNGQGFQDTSRSGFNPDRIHIINAHECILPPAPESLKCHDCVYSYNYRHLNPDVIMLEQEPLCLPNQTNSLNEWKVTENNHTTMHCGIERPYCVAELRLINGLTVSVRRTCDSKCVYSTNTCTESGFGLSKTFCRSCCTTDFCNNWGNSEFYTGKVMTPIDKCVKNGTKYW